AAAGAGLRHAPAVPSGVAGPLPRGRPLHRDRAVGAAPRPPARTGVQGPGRPRPAQRYGAAPGSLRRPGEAGQGGRVGPQDLPADRAL
ncbi:MAG: hypothetical protein AVDCRST_MAG60-1118, partial [uncultured Nocardioides sp.]